MTQAVIALSTFAFLTFATVFMFFIYALCRASAGKI